MSHEQALAAPLTIGDLVLRNSIIMSSLTRSRAPEIGIPNDVNVLYYKQRAKSAGLIMSEGTLVSEQGAEWCYPPGIYSIEHAEGWKKVTDAVHEEGGRIFCQLWHVGRLAHPDMPRQHGKPVQAPSPVCAKGGNFRYLNHAPYVAPSSQCSDPQLLVEEFRRGASFAKAAGFDGVEAHGASGYLLAQFFDPRANQRTDKWGGSLENRARFPLEVLKAMISVFGKERVGVKLAPAGGLGGVGVPHDQCASEFSYLIMEIVKLEIAYVQLVRVIPPSPTAHVSPDTTQIDVVGIFGPLVKGTKTQLLVNGGYEPATDGEQTLKDGHADGIVFGRHWINNPDFASRVCAGQPMNETLGFPVLQHALYGEQVEDLKKGYTDYPTYEEVVKN